jgi:hypothetical protein|tara:strand:+ start:363 stop:494 length:132 start_codon:yes stop_codon:yes gene_type:complete
MTKQLKRMKLIPKTKQLEDQLTLAGYLFTFGLGIYLGILVTGL